MDYRALIQNRKSVREFTEKPVFFGDLDKVRAYYNQSVRRLMPEIRTELRIFGTDARAALEGAAGYHQFLVGAPQYMVLLSDRHPYMHLNAGYIMEDLILKLTEMDFNTCWLTFADSEDIKKALNIDSAMEVAAIAAFGYGAKTTKRLRLNMRSMSDVDIAAKHRYMEPKRSVSDLVFVETWGNQQDLDRHIGFFDDVLWEALYAVSLAPSYLNRQAYGFLLHNGSISLVSRPDAHTVAIDGDLSLGIALLHFTAVAENWVGKLRWSFDESAEGLRIPDDHKLIATASL